MVKIGDKVTYHAWIADSLQGVPATVTGVYEDDGQPQAVVLQVDFTDEVVAIEGYLREQSHSRLRTHPEDDRHAGGTWTPVS